MSGELQRWPPSPSFVGSVEPSETEEHSDIEIGMEEANVPLFEDAFDAYKSKENKLRN